MRPFEALQITAALSSHEWQSALISSTSMQTTSLQRRARTLSQHAGKQTAAGRRSWCIPLLLKQREYTPAAAPPPRFASTRLSSPSSNELHACIHLQIISASRPYAAVVALILAAPAPESSNVMHDEHMMAESSRHTRPILRLVVSLPILYGIACRTHTCSTWR